MDVLGNLEVRWVQGFTSNSVEFVDKNTVCYTCGNFIVSLNLYTKARKVLLCSPCGIEVFTANGLSRTLAFSEQKLHPCIFVYGYPELNLKCEIKGTAKLSYTALALSEASHYLACCSSVPDCTITVWNWKTGVPICSKSLTEGNITTLVFNPSNWQQICAINSRFLTVWNIERSNGCHVIKSSVIDLPASGGSVVELEVKVSHIPGQKLTYYGPQMPTSAVAGLIDDRADHFMPQKPRLIPSAVCWSASSDLYVGSKEGYLLLVNPETLLVSILYKPHIEESPPDSSGNLTVHEGSCRSLALRTNEMFATGSNVLQKIQIKGTQVKVVGTWTLEEPSTTLCFSPDYETLLLHSNTGCIYKCKPDVPDKVDKILNVLCGDFVAGVPLYTEKNICVTVRKSGHLQVWSLDSGSFIGSTSLQAEVSSFACCPIAQYVAVGTVTGHVLFVDLTSKQQPRIVHSVHLYHVPVDLLVFDQGGNFLIAAASVAHVFVLNARPSKGFEIIGYTEVLGAIVSLSTLYLKDNNQVKVLVLCDTDQQDGKEQQLKEGNLLLLLSLSVQQITGAESCVDHRGCLCEDVLCRWVYETPQSLASCVLGTQKIFGYCHQKKALQSFHLPETENTDNSLTQKAVSLQPEKEVEGHSLGPALVHLSPHQLWLTSVGRDGLLRFYDISSMERYVQIQCHSYWLGGGRFVSFTPDSQTLLTSGFQDGCLVCSRLRLKTSGIEQANEASQYGESMVASFEGVMSCENPVLSAMTLQTQPPLEAALGSQTRQVRTFRAENQQFSGTKKKLKNSIKELRDTIRAMMMENDSLPDMEKLNWQEFNLDVGEYKKLQAKGEQEITKVQEETVLENMATSYLYDVFTKKCWDTLKVKGAAVTAFHSMYEVSNYPMWERTAKELEELQRVETIRKTELANSKLKTKSLEASVERKEQEGEKEQESNSLALVGSLSTQYGGFNPYLYSQFNLHIRERIMNQIILLQDIIYKVKTAFNAEFDAVYKYKEKEFHLIRINNKRITEIMTELDLKKTLWAPVLKGTEKPETSITVIDSEPLEVEINQLQTCIKDATQAFDETTSKLYEIKLKTEMAICQEELKIANLSYSLLTEEEIRNREKELNYKLQKAKTLKNESAEALKKYGDDVEMFRETYDNVINEDKIFDKGFHKEFFDVPGHIVDQLYKLYKRRPRVERIRMQSHSPFKKRPLSGRASAAEGFSQMMKAMDELDAPENMPDGLDPAVWEKFCLARRAKVESEQQVKIKALTLAEMQAFLQKRTSEEDNAQTKIDNLIHNLNGLRQERMRFCLDIMVQFLIKKGQVEVKSGDFIADYSDSVLLHCRVIEDLNRTIKAFGEQKIASMAECKDFRKGIIQQEWERKRMKMQIEDLNNKANYVENLYITQEIQEYLNETGQERISKLVASLDMTLKLHEKTHKQSIDNCKMLTKNLNKQADQKKRESAALDLRLASTQVTVADRVIIYESLAKENPMREATERYKDIIYRKKLVKLAKAQTAIEAMLRVKVEHLRMKKFPAFRQLIPL